MDRDEFLAWVVRNGCVIGAAAQEAPDRGVPSCPDWRLRDLGFHVGCILNLWADVVRRAGAEPRPIGSGMVRPPDEELERFVRSEVESVVSVLEAADEDAPAWNWWGPQTARWIPRVLAHETSVHGWDAGNALGRPTTMDPELAADGVVEFFDVWILRSPLPPRGLQGSIALRAVDVGASWVVHVGAEALPDITKTESLGDASVTVRAPVADLLLLLWRRLPPSALDVGGDREFLGRFLAYPNLS